MRRPCEGLPHPAMMRSICALCRGDSVTSVGSGDVQSEAGSEKVFAGEYAGEPDWEGERTGILEGVATAQGDESEGDGNFSGRSSCDFLCGVPASHAIDGVWQLADAGERLCRTLAGDRFSSFFGKKANGLRTPPRRAALRRWDLESAESCSWSVLNAFQLPCGCRSRGILEAEPSAAWAKSSRVTRARGWVTKYALPAGGVRVCS